MTRPGWEALSHCNPIRGGSKSLGRTFYTQRERSGRQICAEAVRLCQAGTCDSGSRRWSLPGTNRAGPFPPVSVLYRSSAPSSVPHMVASKTALQHCSAPSDPARPLAGCSPRQRHARVRWPAPGSLEDAQRGGARGWKDMSRISIGHAR